MDGIPDNRMSINLHRLSLYHLEWEANVSGHPDTSSAQA